MNPLDALLRLNAFLYHSVEIALHDALLLALHLRRRVTAWRIERLRRKLRDRRAARDTRGR